MNTSNSFNVPSDAQPLIDAAIRFGDWIARQPETTETDRASIVKVQEAFRRLPDAPVGMSLKYGLLITHGNLIADYDGAPENGSVTRVWTASIFWPNSERADVTIGSSYTSLPQQNSPGDDLEHETTFEFTANAVPLMLGEYVTWINQVALLDNIRVGASRIEVSSEARELPAEAIAIGKYGPFPSTRPPPRRKS